MDRRTGSRMMVRPGREGGCLTATVSAWERALPQPKIQSAPLGNAAWTPLLFGKARLNDTMRWSCLQE